MLPFVVNQNINLRAVGLVTVNRSSTVEKSFISTMRGWKKLSEKITK